VGGGILFLKRFVIFSNKNTILGKEESGTSKENRKNNGSQKEHKARLWPINTVQLLKNERV